MLQPITKGGEANAGCAEIGELSTQLASSAYERVVYKEERDIVEAPERSYEQVWRALDDKRLLFRA